MELYGLWKQGTYSALFVLNITARNFAIVNKHPGLSSLKLSIGGVHLMKYIFRYRVHINVSQIES